jgi:hypothetical protein
VGNPKWFNRIEKANADESAGSVQKWLRDQSEGNVAMVLSPTPEGGEVGSAFVGASGVESAQADDQIAQGGEVQGSMSGAHGGSIFAEGDVTHVMQRTFNGPMPAAEGLELCGVHFRVRAAGEDDFDFFSDAQGLEVMSGANEDGGLQGMREAGLFRCDLKGIDLAGFMTAVGLVQSDVRREKKRRPPSGRVWPIF